MLVCRSWVWFGSSCGGACAGACGGGACGGAGAEACTCVGACVCDKSVDDKNSLVNLFLSVRYALYGVSLRE